MAEGGPYYGQQGYYADYQATGLARPNGQAASLSRPEAIRLYEINLTAYHESGRRRERLICFYTAVNFALVVGLALIYSLSTLSVLIKGCSFVALFVALPICSAWKRALDQCRQESELALRMLRQLETDYALRYSPLGDETKPDSKGEDLARRREQYLPRMLWWAYLFLALYVWHAEVLSVGQGCIDWVFSFISPAGPRRP